MTVLTASRRVAAAGALIVALAACSSAAAPPPIPTAAPTAAPTLEATPTLKPTPDAAAFSVAYLAIVAALNAAQCPGQAIIDATLAAHPPNGTLAAWQQAMSIIGPAVANAAASLQVLEPPAAVQGDVAMLLQAWAAAVAIDKDITTATSIAEVVNLFNNFAPTRQLQGVAATAIRIKLSLPPPVVHPCA